MDELEKFFILKHIKNRTLIKTGNIKIYLYDDGTLVFLFNNNTRIIKNFNINVSEILQKYYKICHDEHIEPKMYINYDIFI